MSKPMITMTDAAAARVKELIDRSEKPVQGLRVGVNSRGCSGMSYVVEYAEEQGRFEDVVESKGVKIFIDPTAVMFLIGSEMDYVEDKFQTGFVFSNPNEKGRCGCGESFHI
ncbi:HesB/IscA family protein [Denitrobaculum tricleocarpae]|uniref:Iron-sulfur cluster assembly accessory protein n=1 Tax=Denitrobaculum tricleocarpae TaxID=2591009 RepID=A0A545TQI0_9PROT|nr:iron-sulfur cluster assembly accessory protein [Denitrobaculum tricleocarpae]TQV79381.1 iron-sulfur cluster assembly accessory protein [Denitrobaculum tricleocarpae]